MAMISKLFICTCSSFIFLLAASPILAVSVSISNVPSSIDKSAEFEVDVQTSCTSCGDSYLRAAFFQGSTDYSGLTQNNSGEWIEGSNQGKYFKIDDSASWSGKLKVKFDSKESLGNYNFKVGAYATQNSSSVEWSDKVSIVITGPSPTPTLAPTATPVPPTNTPKPTSTPKPEPTSKPVVPTATAAPIPTKGATTAPLQPTPTKYLSPTPTNIPLPNPSPIIGEGNQKGEVLSVSVERNEEKINWPMRIGGILAIIAGAGLVLGSLGLFVKNLFFRGGV